MLLLLNRLGEDDNYLESILLLTLGNLALGNDTNFRSAGNLKGNGDYL